MLTAQLTTEDFKVFGELSTRYPLMHIDHEINRVALRIVLAQKAAQRTIDTGNGHAVLFSAKILQGVFLRTIVYRQINVKELIESYSWRSLTDRAVSQTYNDLNRNGSFSNVSILHMLHAFDYVDAYVKVPFEVYQIELMQKHLYNAMHNTVSPCISCRARIRDENVPTKCALCGNTNTIKKSARSSPQVQEAREGFRSSTTYVDIPSYVMETEQEVRSIERGMAIRDQLLQSAVNMRDTSNDIS